MQMTSAYAAKLLRKYNDEYKALLKMELQSKTFVAALEEDLESARTEYNYADTQKQLAELEAKIRKLKHAVNVFNTTTVIPEFNITIDEMLVLIPQLTRRKEKLSDMKDTLPKKRAENRTTKVIDYIYANYDVKACRKDFEQAAEELAKAQMALDTVNSSVSFEFEP
ncbi:MAG: hypothetical protein K6G50_02240 [bacterium]|nr:hypothetical protein [bacterium]